MKLKEDFGKHWINHFNECVKPDTTILLASSGGLDSSVLAHLFKANNIPFILAHVNFQLRGEESERDEKFVIELGKRLSVQVFVKKFETTEYAEINKLSIQEAAREIRYNWFSELLEQTASINFIATAHHTDDSIETMLMHFFRGTGIEGLTGIPAWHKEKKVIRPLLPFTRKELEAYALANGIKFVTDSSNTKDDYTRNYFRNQLIPQLQEVFPQVSENLQRNLIRFEEAALLYKEAVELTINKIIEQKANEYHIPILKWKKLVPLQTITWEIIRKFGFFSAQTNEVIKLLDAENASTIYSTTHRIIKNRAWMIIAPLATKTSEYIVIEKEGSTHFENGTIEIKIIANQPHPIIHSTGVEYLDASKVQFPLLLRKWKVGDYFYPLGMTKKKKLSKFFIDAKLSKTEKESIWVIEMGQKIICIIGMRIDNRFKYSEKSSELFSITYRK
jgi:tRNA(Ile)-lysidine synthase